MKAIHFTAIAPPAAEPSSTGGWRHALWRSTRYALLAAAGCWLLKAQAAEVAAPPSDGPALYRAVVAGAAPAGCLRVAVRGDDGVPLAALHARAIAEGWSWPEPAAAAQGADYLYQALPLGSEFEEDASYQAEDRIGSVQTMQVRRRIDYYLAYPNGGEFADDADDEPVGSVVAEFCPLAPATRESTTFWKATAANPVDFTLRKRYLIGRLQRVAIVDRDDGHLLAEHRPHSAATPQGNQP